MRIYKTKNYDEMSRKAANIISAQIILKPESVLGLATGSSPIGTYKQLIEWYNKGDLDFSQIRSINLDEYKGLPADNDQSYAYLMSLEMILDVEIFKNQGPIKEATLVPLVFPLLAGAGAFTTLLSLRAEYASVNIIIALVLNMIWVYFVVSMTGRVERFLGKGGIYIIRKFFGIILLAISVRLFMANITLLVEALHKT